VSERLIVIGAGLAGLFAAITAAQSGVPAALVSLRASERAQSVMAEGGISAALGADDSAQNHYRDTLEAGYFLADPNAVRKLTEAAPGIVQRLLELGTLFTIGHNNTMELRSFGGQKTKRTVFAQSETGKQIISAVVQEARKYEARGLIRRYSHHCFVDLLRTSDNCGGCIIRDTYSNEPQTVYGSVIIATGGMHGLFGNTTGSLDNSGAACAALFRMGIPLANSEFIQYHPTTAVLPGRQLLISEAARGEGGRLFILNDNRPYYFMEERYPKAGNLAPRDIISREMWLLGKQYGAQVYLDLTGLSETVFTTHLADTLEDCLTYLRIDPRKKPLPVSPGVHYFMGGIKVDESHRTVLPGLYAAGECCCQYHGANRLGGNSLLGAIHGGITAAESAIADGLSASGGRCFSGAASESVKVTANELAVQTAVRDALGIARDHAGLKGALAALEAVPGDLSLLAQAVLISALERRESRGAHFRTDFPEPNDAEFRKTSVAVYDGSKITLHHEQIPDEAIT
jgi:succinate dehydrogenase / fumarate reductase flavoprotein subunit